MDKKFRQALKDGAEQILEMDGGGSHLPAEIPQFLTKLEEGYARCSVRRRDHPALVLFQLKQQPERLRHGTAFFIQKDIESGRYVSG